MGERFHRGFTAAEKTELWDRWKRGVAGSNSHCSSPLLTRCDVLIFGSSTGAAAPVSFRTIRAAKDLSALKAG